MLLAGSDYAVVVAGCEFAREHEQRLAREAGDRNRVRAGEVMVVAEYQGERLGAQGPAAHSSHGFGEERQPDVELAREYPAGDLGAEELAGDYSQIRAVMLDGGQDRAEGLVSRPSGRNPA